MMKAPSSKALDYLAYIGIGCMLIGWLTDFSFSAWLGIPWAIFTFAGVTVLMPFVPKIWQRMPAGALWFATIPLGFGAALSPNLMIPFAVVGAIYAVNTMWFLQILEGFSN
ncbi:hypothetical protein A7P95_07695 [Eikenella longinqua]|uniref:Uncharacterized protein n=1 Tax=Eikenella longinqua TaxID=1795827 RepID=A0A1A9RW20_9NEIS|nr:hypothetical protein [Eikenella longinqua]OAM26643.1 hypothetical protein A7P95_07695 [Eikenella longinqua]